MSEQVSHKPGPEMADSVEEVQAVFPSPATLEDAIAKLTLAGFDRAELSLPITNPSGSHATPEQGAETPVTDTDVRQARTMGTGMASSIGAMAAAGATIATGGAAGLAIAAAAAVGIGSGLAANAIGTSAKDARTEGQEDAAREGHLVLAVHAGTSQKKLDAERIMRDAGATKVAVVTRTAKADAVVDSTGWTG